MGFLEKKAIDNIAYSVLMPDLALEAKMWRNSMSTMCRLMLVTFVFGTLAGPKLISAQTPARPRVAANDARAGGTTSVYEAGQAHLKTSRVFIHVYKTGFGHEHGVVGLLKQGHVLLDEGRGSGELVFDMQSFDADSDQARRYVGLSGSTDASTRQQVNANMHGPGVLDTKTHPTATFKIKSVTKLATQSRRSLPQYQLDGDFTLHGATQPIRVMADVEPKNGWLHLRGGFSILQSNYGITPFKKAFGAVGVGDRLDIWGDLWIASERLVTNQPARR